MKVCMKNWANRSMFCTAESSNFSWIQYGNR